MRCINAGHDRRGLFDLHFLPVRRRALACALLLAVPVGAWAAPDPFSFTDQAGVATGTPTTSNEITVSGIEGTLAIDVTGGFYSVNGGAFGSAAGTIGNGSTVRVRVTSAPEVDTARNARLTIGDAFDVFTVTTGPDDTSPNQFRFTDQTGVAPGSTRFAGAVTIEGINTATPISVIGGDYRVNEGTFTRVPGMVNAGDVVRVRQQASFQPLTDANTKLMVGSTIDTFTTMSNDTDVVPEQFGFDLVRYQDKGVTVESMPVVPTGYNGPSPVKPLAGTAYRIIGGAGGGAGGPNPYVTAPGTIEPGQAIQVRHNAAKGFDRMRVTGVLVGGVRGDFSSKTSGAECDQAAQLDPEGQVILPPDASEVQAPVNVDEDLGLVSLLYPASNTTTDAFYPNLPCEPSIGGELPAEQPPTDEELAAAAYLNHYNQGAGATTLAQLQANPLPPPPPLPAFNNGECSIRGAAGGTTYPCTDPIFLNPAMPFEGRDIIYVHGLYLQHISDRIADPTGPASALWPQDALEFTEPTGYYRQLSQSYWTQHIIEHLSNQNPSFTTVGWQYTPADNSTGPVYAPKPNRYLTVAYSSNQTLEYGMHAILTQIHQAMATGKNVITPPTYPADQFRPFCATGCIIIGHSTGPLVTSAALAHAYAGFYGPGASQIVPKILAHVSFNGAISGSVLATLGRAVANAVPTGAEYSMVCNVLDKFLNLPNSCARDLSWVQTSILRDLDPAIAQQYWGEWVNFSPVPTVTLAGGHPIGDYDPTSLLVPGVNDGVVTMDSACGTPNPVFPGVSPPSGLTVTSLLKAFDFSEVPNFLQRGGGLLLHQKKLLAGFPWGGISKGSRYLSAGCTPYLSVAGMVMPYQNVFPGTNFDARRRKANHYSLMQSLAGHSYNGAGVSPDYFPSFFGYPASDLRHYAPWPFSSPNVEESRAVTDPTIYTRVIDTNGTKLAKPFDMHEIKRGRKIAFKFPINLGSCEKIPGGTGLKRYWCAKWIWKRTYHLADKWELKQDSHYAYEYIGRR